MSHCLKAGAAVAAWIIAPATAGAASLTLARVLVDGNTATGTALTDLGGGLYIVDTENRAEAEALIAADPFSKVDLFERVLVTVGRFTAVKRMPLGWRGSDWRARWRPTPTWTRPGWRCAA